MKRKLIFCKQRTPARVCGSWTMIPVYKNTSSNLSLFVIYLGLWSVGMLDFALFIAWTERSGERSSRRECGEETAGCTTAFAASRTRREALSHHLRQGFRCFPVARWSLTLCLRWTRTSPTQDEKPRIIVKRRHVDRPWPFVGLAHDQYPSWKWERLRRR